MSAIFKKIPSTQEAIPAIGLGTWSTFDVPTSDARVPELSSVLKSFNSSGGKLIDTSPMYGNAERTIGHIASKLNLHEQLFLATKIWTTGKQEGIQQLNNSFKKLQTDKIDLVQVHNMVDAKTHLSTLREWRAQGKIRYIGITHYTTSLYTQLINLIKTESFDFVQFNYNIVVREAEKLLLPTAAEYGVAVIANRPFEDRSLFSRKKALPGWAHEYNIHSWSQYFLKYIISHPDVTCVIPATSSHEHILDNMHALIGPVPDEKIRKEMVSYFNA
ncbi:MAG TPA: aldo/keto reductase [Cyclobacteriaceae bacterium]|jgi:diketogulonate reductase-like aldo/keto reductase|nr:aldo/keto reductase [Cyclobacteriaceae bacterium]